MNRRQWLATGIPVAAVGVLAPRLLLAPPPTRLQRTRAELAAVVCAGLDEDARARAWLPYDHPLRQYYNRGLGLGGARIHAGSLDWEGRRALSDLVALGLSPAGVERTLSQVPRLLTGVNFLDLLVFGDPRNGPFQVILSAVHLNLRLGGTDARGTVFGGPQVYGDQRGNGRVGLPGNRFRHQLLAGQALWQSLTPAQRKAVRLPQAPSQTCIGLQGGDGGFDGLPVGDLSPASRQRARQLVDSMLDSHADAEVQSAWACLEHHGGIDALRFADYEEDFQGGRRAGEGASQVFRLEGPAAVFHFRGEPHLHAFTHIARDADRAGGAGELLAHNPAALAGEDLRRWFETAMREQAQADFAHYPGSAVAGRLRAGPVHTGDIWAAESWNNELAVCEFHGKDIAPPLARAMAGSRLTPQAGNLYRVAVPRFFLGGDVDRRMGRARSVRVTGSLREVFTVHARQQGFREAST